MFYPPAFAALTGWYGTDRGRALTILTLAAGFASTIFAPLTAELAAQLSWREVYLVLAGVLAVVTIPAHAWGLRLPWASHDAPSELERLDRDRSSGAVLTSRRFLVLVMAMTLSAFALYAVVVNLVPLLTGRGMSATLAAWAIGLGGVGQVAGRLGYRLLADAGVRARAIAIMLAGPERWCRVGAAGRRLPGHVRTTGRGRGGWRLARRVSGVSACAGGCGAERGISG